MIAASARWTAELAEHNVPVPLASLIGRSSELDGINETLRRTRLVTVTGPGGVGKTRLAIEVAGRQVGRRPNGVWLVDLTAGSDPAAFKNITAAAASVLAAIGTASHQTKPGRASDRDAERTIHGLASARSTGGRSQRE